MSNIGRTTGYSVAEAYIKTKGGKKCTRREMEKYIKHDKFSQKVFRDHPDCRDKFWEGVDEALRVQHDNYSTRIFTSSFRAAEEIGDYKRAQKVREQIELSVERLKIPLRPDEILGKPNDNNR